MKESFDFKPTTESEVLTGPEKLRSYLADEQRKLSAELIRRQECVPPEMRVMLSPAFRIEPPTQMYSDGDKRIVENTLIKEHGSIDEGVIAKNEDKRSGFLFEMLKTAIMHKKMGDRFIVVRSSRYDDIVNKVDNVFVDLQTGQTICALDEISTRSMSDPEASKKSAEISARNFGFAGDADNTGLKRIVAPAEQGMRLKYGIELNGGKISCSEVEHLPIFLLSLNQFHLNQALSQFQKGSNASDYENKLFKYFLSSISLQIQGLHLDARGYNNLPVDMRTRIESFEAFLKEQGM